MVKKKVDKTNKEQPTEPKLEVPDKTIIRKIEEYLGDLVKLGEVKIIHLWGNNFRVNIRNKNTLIILKSFFVQAVIDGIISCNPGLD